MRTVFIIFLAFLLFSCDSDRLFEKNITLENRYWLAKEPIVLDFKIEDSSKPYNIYYNVRNSLEYPYARLFVQYTLSDSTGLQIDKKLNARYLFDQKTGKPFGQSGIGDVFDHQFLLIEKQVFNYPGKYQLRIEQFNRQDTLRGILAVGARVETIKTSK
jgi:gliding motility-associated lipoprotein GldH